MIVRSPPFRCRPSQADRSRREARPRNESSAVAERIFSDRSIWWRGRRGHHCSDLFIGHVPVRHVRLHGHRRSEIEELDRSTQERGAPLADERMHPEPVDEVEAPAAAHDARPGLVTEVAGMSNEELRLRLFITCIPHEPAELRLELLNPCPCTDAHDRDGHAVPRVLRSHLEPLGSVLCVEITDEFPVGDAMSERLPAREFLEPCRIMRRGSPVSRRPRSHDARFTHIDDSERSRHPSVVSLDEPLRLSRESNRSIPTTPVTRTHVLARRKRRLRPVLCIPPRHMDALIDAELRAVRLAVMVRAGELASPEVCGHASTGRPKERTNLRDRRANNDAIPADPDTASITRPGFRERLLDADLMVRTIRPRIRDEAPDTRSPPWRAAPIEVRRTLLEIMPARHVRAVPPQVEHAVDAEIVSAPPLRPSAGCVHIREVAQCAHGDLRLVDGNEHFPSMHDACHARRGSGPTYIGPPELTTYALLRSLLGASDGQAASASSRALLGAQRAIRSIAWVPSASNSGTNSRNRSDQPARSATRFSSSGNCAVP